MNKNIYFLLIISFLFLNFGCFVGKNDDIGQVKADLEEYIANAENMIDLANSEFSIKPVEVIPSKPFDEKDTYNFITQYTKYLSIDEFLTAVNKDFFLATEFGKTKSLASISLNILDANELLGLGEDVEKASLVMPQFKPSVFHFWDGTSADANYKVDKNTEELEYNHFLLAAAKPVRSIDFDVEFKHYLSRPYLLDSANPKIKVGNDIVEMKSNANGEVKLSYPKSLSKKLSEVQGYYKDGRALKKSGSSSYSISSAENIAWLKKVLPIYEETISLIDQQKLKEADAAFDKAIALAPDNYLTLSNYAYYLALRNHDLPKAEALAEKAAKALPKNASVLDTYAMVLLKQGKYELAKNFIESALQNNEALNPVYLEHYGDILYLKGDKENAILQWQKAQNAGNVSEKLIKKINEKKYIK